MKTLLCFGDSNTWGYIPGSGERYSPAVRWTGLLQQQLGPDVRVIEEGLNGRTTTLDEPYRPGRNGAAMLGPLLESHAPLDLVIMMLGTNDLKRQFNTTAYDAARGAAVLVRLVAASAAGVGGGPPPLLLVAPPRIESLSAEAALELAGAELKSLDFARHYGDVARQHDCDWCDAAQWLVASPLDGVHLDEAGHRALAAALAKRVAVMLDGTERAAAG